MARTHVRAHETILLEYLTKYYAGAEFITNVRVGRPTAELEAQAALSGNLRMYEIVLPTVDAIVFLPEKVVLIEVSTEVKTVKVCQLMLYNDLFDTTERLKPYWGKPREMLVISTDDNDLMRWFANKHGVRWVTYVPAWWPEFTATRQARKFTSLAARVPTTEEKEE